jgi:hypothetical protein
MVIPWHYGMERMFSGSVALTTYSCIILILAVIGSGVIQTIGQKFPALRNRWIHSYAELIYLCLVFVYSLMRLAAGTYNPFIYFRF